MAVLIGFVGLLACQLLGELIVKAGHLPIPGPVAGMIVMLIALMVRGRVPDGVRLVSEGLLKYLTLLYVPAGVGIMVYFATLGQNLLTIAVTLVGSIVLTQVVTALVLKALTRKRGQNEADCS
ncbi:CidA/LrgA family protein [Larsenimonas suaedae]|uniref:CidA/LrgA family protein n=1 Tax=Larsenimonas suaedae TaxID=1851019 RepID=A0ABU1GV92_9GAMM|nr:CidA/LrgA family protein [Larsenimonas suaedae]MCM2971260.1 CidA/LrgA family protein [Larsenimonas suaedae]MDR5895969.1 CidA/LrgA family protein [Larsenimonas suaedae]